MSDRLSLSAELNRPYAPASTYDDEPIYAVLTLQPEAEAGSTQRAPLNLCLVVDSSATMYNFQLTDDEREYWMSLAISRNEMERGEADDRDAVYWSGQTLEEMEGTVRKPMSMAVQALKQLLRSIQHGDKASVVVFADKTHTLFTDQDWENDPEHCIGELDRLLEQRLPIDIGMGTRMASSLDSASELLAHTATNQTVNRIIVISDGIVQDEPATMAAITRIEHEGYAITTLGVGDEFDEEFLMRVADNTRGAYYYAADINEITDKLLTELTVIQSTAIHQVYVTASGIGDDIVKDVFMVQPYMNIFEELESGGGWVKARVGDLPSNMPTSLLIQIAPALHEQGDATIANVEIAWQEGDEEKSLSTSIAAKFTDKASLLGERNAAIQDLVDRFTVFKFEREAQRAQEKGDMDLAREKLGAATKELYKLGESELATELEAQIKTLGDPDQDPSRLKRIKATTRRLGEKAPGSTRQLTPKA
ncbi:MAG: VWA domain-containing protein [Capsulimonadaceae bacterium]|nr:VWA domain-containing protein [Capsulimonadaceae bacterium]